MWYTRHVRNASLVSLLWVVGTSVCFAQGIQENPIASSAQWIEDEIIVKFNPGCPSTEIEKIHAEMSATPVAVGHDKNIRLVKIPPGMALDEMIKAYSKNPHVRYAEKNFVAHAHMVPNDPYYTEKWQWNFFAIDMVSAWGIQTGNSDVIVAVLDTGVAYENYTEGIGRRTKKYFLAPDLAGTQFVAGYDFINNDTHPNDDNSHGTHVTGTIAQTTNNGLGVAGIAYNCAIMPVKVLDGNGSGSYSAIANGIRWATDNGAHVINMSLGGPSPSQTLEDAVNYAYNKGVTIVASSGNDAGAVGYPAAYVNVIAVGATHSGDQLASYSNYGAAIDLVAPGGDSVDRNGDSYGDGVLQNTFNPTTKNLSDFNYWFFSGTSMAAPHVSGVAALLIANGIIDPDLVRQAMQTTAIDLGVEGWDQYYGWGLVNAYDALNYTIVPNTAPVADAGGPYAGTEDSVITFDGSGSYDTDGDTMTYLWNFGDGSTGTGVKPTHIYVAGGTYTVTLVVNDGKVDSATCYTEASIVGVNDPPVAVAGLNQSAVVGQPVTFDGSGSYDIDGDTLTYSWTFGDGTTPGTGVKPTHIYVAGGTYTVTLVVNDGKVDSIPSTATVTVTEQEGLSMHVASIVMSSTKAGTTVTASATVTVVDAVGKVVGGAIVSGHWDGVTRDIDSGVTNSSGKVQLSSDKTKTRGIFTFTIDNITKTGWKYIPGDNVKTGNSITIR
jgi:serine protease